MKLTVAYITGRRDPRLDWALDELAAQRRHDDEINVVVVDALLEERSPGLLVDVHAFKSICHVMPKPTIWQGRHRVTDIDWWAMSNARNTAFCMCRTEWIAFLDDRCIPGKEWLETVREAVRAREPYVLCGSYEKYHNILAFDSMRVAVDNRYKESGGRRMHNCGGQWLYGCTFALPLQWALEVNGFEEGCDGLSAEDYIFGMNLANAGKKIVYDPRMMVRQDRSPGHDNTFRRTDKGVSPNDKSHAALARFGQRSRTEFTPDLRALRDVILAGGKYPTPEPGGDYRDWYDDQPIQDFR